MTASRVLLGLLGLRGAAVAAAVDTCPGSVHVDGYGPVTLTNALWNVPGEPAAEVGVDKLLGAAVPSMTGRTYFADSCSNATYGPSRYSNLKLLGKTFRYTVDLSGAGCGCNAALYLTSLHQNNDVSGCHDYYCDANSVCGVACAEIDIQEANMFAWSSTLHLRDDGAGTGAGYGGGATWNGHREWRQEDYGPNSECIQTTKPFQVAASFPIDAFGRLQDMTVQLSQEGRTCSLSANVGQAGYWHNERDGMSELAVALHEGMTPIISYWSSKDMLWMDGKGADGQGPCDRDDPSQCSSSVKFYDFSVGPIDSTVEHVLRRRLFV